jgi:hypothetical protein
MGAETKTTTDPRVHADAAAVPRHAMHDELLIPHVSRRVHERAVRVTERVRRVHGEIDDGTIHDLPRGDDGDDEQ